MEQLIRKTGIELTELGERTHKSTWGRGGGGGGETQLGQK